MIEQQSNAALAPIIELLKGKKFAAAERMAMEAVRKQPLAAQPWVLLGEALLHRDFGAAARKVFERAWLLDPQASWVAGIERALAQTPAGARRTDVEELLAVKRVTVTAGIIARDEERSIARCLQSLQSAVDEIVLVNCESVDRTVEIASQYPKVRIVDAKWEDDFAALRNTGLAHMHTDWVLWVDADEHLHPQDAEGVRQIAGMFHDLSVPPALFIWQVNSKDGVNHHEFSQTRMFPLNRGLQHYGRVHEQVVTAEGSMYEGKSHRQPVRVRLLHDGYESAIVRSKDKIQRNLHLLRLMTEEEPGNPGWWFYYARESTIFGEAAQALDALEMAEKTALETPRFARLLDVYLLQAKIRLGRNELDLAEEACAKAIACNDKFPDAQFLLATIKMKKGYELYREAEHLLRNAKSSFAEYRGAVSPDQEIAKWKADVTLADVARSTGKLAEAEHIYKSISKRFPYVEQVKKPLLRIEEQYQKLQKART
jgi:glycosyltransferase involved in cell wall biosynthesis